MYKIFFSFLVVIIFFLSSTIIPHGDEKHKGKVEKVSTQMQMEDEHSQMNMSGGSAQSDSIAQSKEKAAIEKDFAQIQEYVENSTVPTVIKAVSLAAFIAGLALLYLPRRKKKEHSNV